MTNVAFTEYLDDIAVLGFNSAERTWELVSSIVLENKRRARRKALRDLRRKLDAINARLYGPQDCLRSYGDDRTDLMHLCDGWRAPNTLQTWIPAEDAVSQHALFGISCWAPGSPPSMRASRLSVAVSTALYDGRDFLGVLISLARAVVEKPARSGKPRKLLLANCIGRVRIALLQFVAGFFGSHKVDARNNP